MDGETIHSQIEAEPLQLVDLKFPDRAEALHYLQDRFVFWTPAILYLYGHLNNDVWTDFQQSINKRVLFYHYNFQVPLFRGLEAGADPSWNCVLWATEREDWEALVDHLCSVTLYHSESKMVFKYALQDVEVIDPIFMRKAISSNAVPVINAQAFGVRTNLWTAAFNVEEAHALLSPPALRFYDEDDDCKMYAQAMFSGSAPEAAIAHMQQKDDPSGNQNGLSPGNGS